MSDLRLRVLMLVANNLPTDARVLKEARGLVKAGATVTVIGYEKAGWRSRRVDEGPLQLVIFPFGAAQVPGIAGKLLRLVTILVTFLRMGWAALWIPVDVVHVHDPHPLPIGWLVAKLRGAKLVYDAHECFPLHFRRGGLEGLARIERLFIHSADRIINVSDVLAGKLAEAYPGIAEQVVVGNYPEAPAGELVGRLRATIGAAPEDRIALYAGGYFLHLRRLDNVVRALASLPPHVKAVFVGYDSQGAIAKLEAIAAETGVADRVRFVDAVPPDQLVSAISDADVGILPVELVDTETYDSSPNKIYEYMAAGLPILSTRIACVEFLPSAGLGVLVESPPTAEAIADGIRKILADPDMARRMRETGPRLVRESYSWESQLARLVALYRGLA